MYTLPIGCSNKLILLKLEKQKFAGKIYFFKFCILPIYEKGLLRWVLPKKRKQKRNSNSRLDKIDETIYY